MGILHYSLKNRKGSVLSAVFIFSIIVLIAVIAFVSGQYMIARPGLKAPMDIQALLNARSGIWKGLELLSHPKEIDTLKRIDAQAPDFNSDLFGDATEAISMGKTQLPANGEPIAIELYGCDSFGASEVALSYRGCFEILQSKGIYKNSNKIATVKLGGVFLTSSDTVLYLENKTPLQSPLPGPAHYGTFDTAGSFRTDDLNKLISYYQTEMSDTVDTMKPSPPLLIQHNNEFDTIPKTVRGPLFIDGAHFDLTWKTKKKIIVLGDLQITGTVALEGMDFLVAGEIKLFDNACLHDVFLFSPKKISIGDKAVFSGTAVTLSNLLVFGIASVENRSILVARKTNSPVSPNRGTSAQKKIFPVTFTGSSTINATVVALNDSLGIKIDRNAMVKGLLKTDGAMCLDGKVYGRIRASKFVDGALAMQGKPLAPLSVIHGTILPLDDFRSYYFPFFIGKLSIIEWREE